MEHSRIYFDNAATSFPKPREVAERVTYYMTEVGSNINRGTYAAAYEAEDVLFDTRQLLTDMFGGGDCRNTVFTPNITTALNVIIRGLLHPGDRVLVSAMEHNAVMRPLRSLERSGVGVDVIPCSVSGEMDIDAAEALCGDSTRAIITTHASNVCGTLMPIEELGKLCARRGLIFVVDSAQTAGLFPIDMHRMNIDALAFTGHKSLLGPQGTGGFLLKEGLAERIEPLIAGGTGSISHTEQMPDFMPDRFEAGTPNLPGLYGLKAALEYLRGHDPAAILKHELELTQRFLDGLHENRKIIVTGRGDIQNRAPVVSVQLRGADQSWAADILDREYGIQARVGLHCAPAAHKTLGTYPTGTLRFSFGPWNTEREVDICLRALEEICHGIQTD